MENGVRVDGGLDVFKMAELGRRLRERRAEIEEAIFTRLPAADGEELARGQREAIRSCSGAGDAGLRAGRRLGRPAIGAARCRHAGATGGAFGSRPLDGATEIHRRLQRSSGLRARGDRADSPARPIVRSCCGWRRFGSRRWRSRFFRPSPRPTPASGSRGRERATSGWRQSCERCCRAHGSTPTSSAMTSRETTLAWVRLRRRCDGGHRGSRHGAESAGPARSPGRWRGWAWPSGGAPVAHGDFPDLGVSPGLRISFGEPSSGQKGFRETHCQAEEAMQVALHQRQLMTRFADVLLLVPAVEDEQRGNSLISIYLSPLEASSEKNPTLKETLRAYFEAELNTTATAARLKVDRRTAMTRLRTVEERLGFPIYKRHAELEVALRLDQLRRSARVQYE